MVVVVVVVVIVSYQNFTCKLRLVQQRFVKLKLKSYFRMRMRTDRTYITHTHTELPHQPSLLIFSFRIIVVVCCGDSDLLSQLFLIWVCMRVHSCCLCVTCRCYNYCFRDLFISSSLIFCETLNYIISHIIWVMYKVLRSYSKKAERKHELTRSTGNTVEKVNGYSTADGSSPIYSLSPSYGIGGGTIVEDVRNGQVVPIDRNGRIETAWPSGQAFSESSSYEAREHFERKVQRVKKTRGERDSNRKSKKSRVGSFARFLLLNRPTQLFFNAKSFSYIKLN